MRGRPWGRTQGKGGERTGRTVPKRGEKRDDARRKKESAYFQSERGMKKKCALSTEVEIEYLRSRRGEKMKRDPFF